MSWVAWVLVGYYARGSVLVVLQVGKPRKPITPGDAARALVVAALMAWGTLYLAGA